MSPAEEGPKTGVLPTQQILFGLLALITLAAAGAALIADFTGRDVREMHGLGLVIDFLKWGWAAERAGYVGKRFTTWGPEERARAQAIRERPDLAAPQSVRTSTEVVG